MIRKLYDLRMVLLYYQIPNTFRMSVKLLELHISFDDCRRQFGFPSGEYKFNRIMENPIELQCRGCLELVDSQSYYPFEVSLIKDMFFECTSILVS